MPYKIEIRPLAAIEIIEAYDWYESAKEGLGMEFLDELEVFYESLNRNPNTYSYYDKPVRPGKIDRFPYVVVYEFIDHSGTVVIYSVFMAKQDPTKKRTM
jgi:plasmid stabilization system protein ParE